MNENQETYQRINLNFQMHQNPNSDSLSRSNNRLSSKGKIIKQLANQADKNENDSNKAYSKDSQIRFIGESIKEINQQDIPQNQKVITKQSGDQSTKVHQAVNARKQDSFKSQRQAYQHKRINTQLSNDTAKTQINKQSFLKKGEKVTRQLLNQQQKYNNKSSRSKPSKQSKAVGVNQKQLLISSKTNQAKINSSLLPNQYTKQLHNQQVKEQSKIIKQQVQLKKSVQSRTFQSNKNIIIQDQKKEQDKPLKTPHFADHKVQAHIGFNLIPEQQIANETNKNVQHKFSNRIAKNDSQEHLSFNLNSSIQKQRNQKSPKNQIIEKRSISRSREKNDAKSLISLSINASSANQRVQIKKLNNKVNSLQEKLRKLQEKQQKQIKKPLQDPFEQNNENRQAKMNQLTDKDGPKNINFRIGRTQPAKLNISSNAVHVNMAQEFNLNKIALNINIPIQEKNKSIQKEGSKVSQQSRKSQISKNRNIKSQSEIKRKNDDSDLIKKIVDSQPKWIINDLYFNNLGKMIDTTKKMSVGVLDKRQKHNRLNVNNQRQTSWQRSAQKISNFQRSIPIRKQFKNRQPAIFKSRNYSLKPEYARNSNKNIDNMKSQFTQQFNQKHYAQNNEEDINDFGESQQPLGLLRNQVPADLPKLSEQIIRNQKSASKKQSLNKRLKSAIRRNPPKKIVKRANNQNNQTSQSQFTHNPDTEQRKVSQNTQFERTPQKYHQYLFKGSKSNQKSLKLKGIQLKNVIKYKSKKLVQQVYDSLEHEENGLEQEFNPLKNQDTSKSRLSFTSGKRVFQLDFTSRKQQIPDDNDDIKIPEEVIHPSKCKIKSLNFKFQYRPPTHQMTVQQLLALGRNAFRAFNINIQQQELHNNFKIIKYRNCVNFNIEGSSNQLIWHYNGKLYFGGWKINSNGQGQKHGSGIEYMPDKFVFQGQFQGGKRNGTGVLQMISSKGGSIYDGQWIDGNKHGDGMYYQKQSKAFYDGQWKNNKRQGFGFLRTSNIQFYVGTFHNSIKHGYGTQFFENGDKYQGQFKQGKFHGKGRYEWRNGSFYDGKFCNGYRQGFGCWRSSKNGGQMYRGQYVNDKKQGKGKYIWSNGTIYEGQFSNDHKNGFGKLIDQYGRQTKGVWLDGACIQKQEEIQQQAKIQNVKKIDTNKIDFAVKESKTKKILKPGHLSQL